MICHGDGGWEFKAHAHRAASVRLPRQRTCRGQVHRQRPAPLAQAGGASAPLRRRPVTDRRLVGPQAAPSPRLPPAPPHSSDAWDPERFFLQRASWASAPRTTAAAVPEEEAALIEAAAGMHSNTHTHTGAAASRWRTQTRLSYDWTRMRTSDRRLDSTVFRLCAAPSPPSIPSLARADEVTTYTCTHCYVAGNSSTQAFGHHSGACDLDKSHTRSPSSLSASCAALRFEHASVVAAVPYLRLGVDG